ncbi:MAG: sterol desaturase family protein [Verrucomicrobiota bacterium]
MILFMDLGMYVFHRIAHHPRLYPLFHRFHHRHETTNPISLFVLHPVEVTGFGTLMILFLMGYPMTVGGLMAYLTLNVVFGTLGHSGVEPLPRSFQAVPFLRLIGTSTFHAEHHEHRQFNFGFYTLIWDKLFGTLDPEYETRFAGRNENREE